MRNLSISEKATFSPAPRFFVAGVDLGQKLDPLSDSRGGKTGQGILSGAAQTVPAWDRIRVRSRISQAPQRESPRPSPDHDRSDRRGRNFHGDDDQIGIEERARNPPLSAQETGCHDVPKTLYGGWARPHTIR